MSSRGLALAEVKGKVSPRPSFSEALAEFLRLKVASGSPSQHTLRSYTSGIADFIAWCRAEGIAPEKATEYDILSYCAHLGQSGLCPGTIRVKLNAVRKIYEAATWRGLRTDDPAQGIRPPKERTEPWEKRELLSQGQIEALLAAPDKSTVKGKRDLAILALAYYNGLRVSELSALSLSDYIASDPARLQLLGKGKKKRTVYLRADVSSILEAHLLERGPGEPFEPLFLSLSRETKGHRISERGIYKIIEGYLEAIGAKRPGISPHSLRHSYATHSLMAGANLLAVSRSMGHSSIKTTEVYLHLANSSKENPSLYLRPLVQG